MFKKKNKEIKIKLLFDIKNITTRNLLKKPNSGGIPENENKAIIIDINTKLFVVTCFKSLKDFRVFKLKKKKKKN